MPIVEDIRDKVSCLHTTVSNSQVRDCILLFLAYNSSTCSIFVVPLFSVHPKIYQTPEHCALMSVITFQAGNVQGCNPKGFVLRGSLPWNTGMWIQLESINSVK